MPVFYCITFSVLEEKWLFSSSARNVVLARNHF